MPSALSRHIGTSTLAMGGGMLLALSMPPLGLYPLAWVALVPLLVRWERLPSGRLLFLEAYVSFLLMAVGAGFWVLFHASTQAALFAGVGLLFIPLPHAAAFALARTIRARYGLGVGLAALVCNVLGVEYVVSHGPGGLPWLLIGHTQAGALSFNQIADLGGVGLLSLFVLATNLFGYAFVRTAPQPGFLPGGRSLLLLLLLAFLSGTAAYGDARRAQLTPPHGEVALALVQPAEPVNRWGDATDWERVERLAALSDRAFRAPTAGDPVQPVAALPPAPRLIVWPEAALPPFPDPEAEGRLYLRLARWSADRQADLLTGALSQSTPRAPLYQSAVFLHRGQPAQEYAKVHLTPLVEHLPFVGRSPALDAMTLPEEGARLASGRAPVLFEGAGYRVAPVIGLESLRGDYVRQLVSDGADVVVALSDGGAWGNAFGSRQHLAMTRLRAIETRRAVVLASASGASALVHPDGRVERLTEWMEEDVAERDMPLHADATRYARHGDWPGRFALFGSGWLLLVLGVSTAFFRRPSRPKQPKRKRPRG